jgi:hypothetical protein
MHNTHTNTNILTNTNTNTLLILIRLLRDYCNTCTNINTKYKTLILTDLISGTRLPKRDRFAQPFLKRNSTPRVLSHFLFPHPIPFACEHPSHSSDCSRRKIYDMYFSSASKHNNKKKKKKPCIRKGLVCRLARLRPQKGGLRVILEMYIIIIFVILFIGVPHVYIFRAHLRNDCLLCVSQAKKKVIK